MVVITLAFQSNKCKFQQIFIECLLCASPLLCIPKECSEQEDQGLRSGAHGAGGAQARKQVITISCEGAVGALRRGSLAGGVGGVRETFSDEGAWSYCNPFKRTRFSFVLRKL